MDPPRDDDDSKQTPLLANTESIQESIDFGKNSLANDADFNKKSFKEVESLQESMMDVDFNKKSLQEVGSLQESMMDVDFNKKSLQEVGSHQESTMEEDFNKESLADVGSFQESTMEEDFNKESLLDVGFIQESVMDVGSRKITSSANDADSVQELVTDVDSLVDDVGSIKKWTMDADLKKRKRLVNDAYFIQESTMDAVSKKKSFEESTIDADSKCPESFVDDAISLKKSTMDANSKERKSLVDEADADSKKKSGQESAIDVDFSMESIEDLTIDADSKREVLKNPDLVKESSTGGETDRSMTFLVEDDVDSAIKLLVDGEASFGRSPPLLSLNKDAPMMVAEETHALRSVEEKMDEGIAVKNETTRTTPVVAYPDDLWTSINQTTNDDVWKSVDQGKPSRSPPVVASTTANLNEDEVWNSFNDSRVSTTDVTILTKLSGLTRDESWLVNAMTTPKGLATKLDGAMNGDDDFFNFIEHQDDAGTTSAIRNEVRAISPVRAIDESENTAESSFAASTTPNVVGHRAEYGPGNRSKTTSDYEDSDLPYETNAMDSDEVQSEHVMESSQTGMVFENSYLASFEEEKVPSVVVSEIFSSPPSASKELKSSLVSEERKQRHDDDPPANIRASRSPSENERGAKSNDGPMFVNDDQTTNIYTKQSFVGGSRAALTFSDLLNAKEDAVRKFLYLDVDENRATTAASDLDRLEYKFKNACDAMDVIAIQQLLSCGGTCNMLTNLFETCVGLFRKSCDAPSGQTNQKLCEMLRAARFGFSTRSRGPARLFCFPGKESYIDVSGTSTFAKSFSTSWGFSCWMWVTANANAFTLLSFLTKERHGISVTVLMEEGFGATLLFEAADEKKRDGCKVVLPYDTFHERSWHFLSIFHSKKRNGHTAGTLTLCVNDKVVEERALAFPDWHGSSAASSASPISKARLMEDFEGFTGPIWITNGPVRSMSNLAKSQVAPLNAEGEDAISGSGLGIGSLAGVLNRGRNPADVSPSGSDFDHYPAVFASYYPERVVGNFCLDLHASRLGTLCGKAKVWTALPARDSLRPLGGPVILLPFIRALGLDDPTNDDEMRVERKEHEVALQALLLLGSVLEGHGPNQNEFYEANGPNLMRYALECLPRGVAKAMLVPPSQKITIRDLIQVSATVVRASSLETTGTANEGSRLMRVLGIRTRSTEHEFDRVFMTNLEFWTKLGDGILLPIVPVPLQQRRRPKDEDDVDLPPATSPDGYFLEKIVQLCAKRAHDRLLAFRKRLGIRFLLDALRKMYRTAAWNRDMIPVARKAGTKFIDTVIAPLFAAGDHVSRDEARAILDAAIGAGSTALNEDVSGSTSVPLRERRRHASWDFPTVELAHDSLRLMARLYENPVHHSTLNSLSVPSVLAVEVVAFGGLGERVRALALRIIGLSLASSSSRDVSEQFASTGGYSYLFSALSHAASKNAPVRAKERRFAASRRSSMDDAANAITMSDSSLMKSPGLDLSKRSTGKSSFFAAASSPSTLFSSIKPNHGSGLRTSASARLVSNPPPVPIHIAAAPEPFIDDDVPLLSPRPGQPSSVGIVSDAIYNSLLSMVVTPTGLGSSLGSNIGNSHEWTRALSTCLVDEEDAAGAPVLVLDDVLKVFNVHALSVVLDLLHHMSPLVQQRLLQDLFVLLKFEPENRKAFVSVPNWQRDLASFLSSQNDADEVGIVQMGVKLWGLVLLDESLRDVDALSQVYWLGETFGNVVPQMVLKGLLEQFSSNRPTGVGETQLPPAVLYESLIRLGELDSQTYYATIIDLVDSWNLPDDLTINYVVLLINETTRVVRYEDDFSTAAKAARRSVRFMSRLQNVDNLVRDAAIVAVSRVHSVLERVQGKSEFTLEEKDFIDSCARLLVEAGRVLNDAAATSSSLASSKTVYEIVELAAVLKPNRAVPMPREAWLHSNFVLNPMESFFSVSAEQTLNDLSNTVTRFARERYDARFSKEQERVAHLAKARVELEVQVHDVEDRAIYAETTRLAASEIASVNENRATADRWTSMVSELEAGETVWRDSKIVDHWTVPEREDYLRRHLILERDLHYRSHDEAAYSNEPRNNAKLAAVEEDMEEDPSSLSSPDISMNISTNSVSNYDDVVAFDAREAIFYAVEGARWVTPALVITGRVEISASHVMFYAAVTEKGAVERKKRGDGGLGWISAGKEKPRSNATRRRQRWRLDELVEIHSRRYLLRPTAIELFFSDRKTAFFAFATPSAREEFSTQLLKQKPIRLEKAFTGSLAPPAQVFKRSKLTESWRKREISNFEYLMRLNTIAGRTYNDVTQYFVFPWILTDYESKDLNLDSYKVFRDLSKPVGALNPQREKEVQERFEEFTQADMGMPAFHHGSHYSSAGVVLHYLIRLEPYTTLAIELQGGRFDVSDRLFHSMRDCFKSCYYSVVDCRELIPEFFYSSEMFVNRDHLNLGIRQDEVPVDDVLLPPWAENDPERFVRMNRESLESEIVSDAIHNWIDLIFGYKQRGKDAELACNVFNHLSYEGAVDLDAIVDPSKRHAVELQILEFGQCPSQLLTHPHPKRMSINEWGRFVAAELVREATYFKRGHHSKWSMFVWRKNAWNPNIASTVAYQPFLGVANATVGGAAAVTHAASSALLAPVKQVSSFVKFMAATVTGKSTSASSSTTTFVNPGSAVTPPALIFLSAFPDRVVLVHADLTTSIVLLIDGGSGSGGGAARDQTSLELRSGNQTALVSAPSSTYVTARPRDAGLVGTALGATLRGRAQDMVVTQGGNLVVSCPYFDGSIRAFRVDGTKIEVNVIGHRARVSCVAQNGRWLVSGSVDGNVVLWHVGGSHDSRDEMLEMFGETSKTAQGPVLSIERHLIGHRSAISCVAISALLGAIVTGGSDGSVLVHGLYGKSYSKIRRLPVRWGKPNPGVDLIAIAPGSGGVLVHSRSSQELSSFTLNGQLLGHVFLDEPLNFCEVVEWHQQEVLVEGGDRSGEIVIRRISDLIVTRKISYAKRYRGVRCAAVAPEGRYIFVGCTDGSLIALGDGTGFQIDVVDRNGPSAGKGVLVSE